VEFHLRNILGKLGARSRTEAVVRAWQLDLLTLPTLPGR
jgi:DNA-binding CsgD family transcriptional regulator